MLDRLLPSSTNADYRGHASVPWVLLIISLLTIAPGLIHSFLPDGGAGVIAGLDLSVNGKTIIGLFGWAGATQIVWGLILLGIAIRWRALVPLAVLLLLVERSLIARNIWARFDETPGGHHPPEAYVTLIAVPILAGLLVLALRAPRQ